MSRTGNGTGEGTGTPARPETGGPAPSGTEDAPGAAPVDGGPADDAGAAAGADEAPAGEKGRGKDKGGGWRESILLIASGVVVALLLRAFVIGTFWIPSESMENTLLENDRVVINRLAGSYERGDIVVFKGWDGTDWIKRVIAVGGDTVTCCDAKHRLSVNGVPVDETPYLYPGDYASGDPFEVTVPKGRLWVMGDHRVASRDSRAYANNRFSGTIAESDVLGRAWAVYWPPSRMRLLSNPGVFDKVR